MPTDLFVAASGWPASALADVVPPACRRRVETAPAPRRDGADAVVELPTWRPRRAARHLVPAFSGLHPAPAWRSRHWRARSFTRASTATVSGRRRSARRDVTAWPATS